MIFVFITESILVDIKMVTMTLKLVLVVVVNTALMCLLLLVVVVVMMIWCIMMLTDDGTGTDGGDDADNAGWC